MSLKTRWLLTEHLELIHLDHVAAFVIRKTDIKSQEGGRYEKVVAVMANGGEVDVTGDTLDAASWHSFFLRDLARGELVVEPSPEWSKPEGG